MFIYIFVGLVFGFSIGDAFKRIIEYERIIYYYKILDMIDSSKLVILNSHGNSITNSELQEQLKIKEVRINE